MNKREKIILAIALATAVYGVIDFMILQRGRGGLNSAPGEIRRNTKDFSARAMAKISKIETREKQSHSQAWIRRIESDWDQDPFLRYPIAGGEKGTWQDSPGPELVFSGYIRVGDKAFAVINGMEYERGETIKPQDFLVKKITSARVVLQRKSEQIVLYLKEE